IPRPFKQLSITFGGKVDTEAVFGDLRRRWRALKRKSEVMSALGTTPIGVLDDDLKFGPEAVDFRKECTEKVRQLVLQVRRSRGHPDEDPKACLPGTWRKEEKWNGDRQMAP